MVNKKLHGDIIREKVVENVVDLIDENESGISKIVNESIKLKKELGGYYRNGNFEVDHDIYSKNDELKVRTPGKKRKGMLETVGKPLRLVSKSFHTHWQQFYSAMLPSGYDMSNAVGAYLLKKPSVYNNFVFSRNARSAIIFYPITVNKSEMCLLLKARGKNIIMLTVENDDIVKWRDELLQANHLMERMGKDLKEILNKNP